MSDNNPDTGNMSGRAARRLAKTEADRAKGSSSAAPEPVKPAAVPITVAGQRHVAPAGRHSQQTHRRAEERAVEQGHATEREQHDSDRDQVLAKLQKSSDGKLAQQRNEQNRRSGVSADKA